MFAQAAIFGLKERRPAQTNAEAPSDAQFIGEKPANSSEKATDPKPVGLANMDITVLDELLVRAVRRPERRRKTAR